MTPTTRIFINWDKRLVYNDSMIDDILMSEEFRDYCEDNYRDTTSFNNIEEKLKEEISNEDEYYEYMEDFDYEDFCNCSDDYDEEGTIELLDEYLEDEFDIINLPESQF